MKWEAHEEQQRECRKNRGMKQQFQILRLPPLTILVGTWNTVGKHRLLKGTTLHGYATFERKVHAS